MLFGENYGGEKKKESSKLKIPCAADESREGNYFLGDDNNHEDIWQTDHRWTDWWTMDGWMDEQIGNWFTRECLCPRDWITTGTTHYNISAGAEVM